MQCSECKNEIINYTEETKNNKIYVEDYKRHKYNYYCESCYKKEYHKSKHTLNFDIEILKHTLNFDIEILNHTLNFDIEILNQIKQQAEDFRIINLIEPRYIKLDRNLYEFLKAKCYEYITVFNKENFPETIFGMEILIKEV